MERLKTFSLAFLLELNVIYLHSGVLKENAWLRKSQKRQKMAAGVHGRSLGLVRESAEQEYGREFVNATVHRELFKKYCHCLICFLLDDFQV